MTQATPVMDGSQRLGSVPINNAKGMVGPSLRVAINAITDLDAKFGSRVYLWELAAALAKIKGVELILLVGEGQVANVPPPFRSLAREVGVSPGRSYSQVFKQHQIREALRGEEIDVYHLPNTLPLIQRVTPTVVTIHDLADLRVQKYGRLRTGYRFLINFLAAHFADRIVTVSENSKRDIVRLLRVPESKVSVIYNGVSDEFRPLDPKKCRDLLKSKYSINGDFLLSPGGLSLNKNIAGILAAMLILKERGRTTLLVLLGDNKNPEFQYVQGMIRQSGFEKAVLLPGFVPREDLPVFYNGASLVIYPTLYEGFGLPVLEAMACGTPVVASNNSSLPEVAGESALLVDPRNPADIARGIERLLSDGKLYSELSSRGLVRAREFTWAKTADETMKVFLTVLREHTDRKIA